MCAHHTREAATRRLCGAERGRAESVALEWVPGVVWLTRSAAQSLRVAASRGATVSPIPG